MQTNLFEPRHVSQKQRILNLLKLKGQYGASNRELNEICFRYGARIKELRDEGYSILTKRQKQGLFVFKLEE